MGGGWVAGLRPEESLDVRESTWLKARCWLGPAFAAKARYARPCGRCPSQINIGCQLKAFLGWVLAESGVPTRPRSVHGSKAGRNQAGCWGCGKCRPYAKMLRHFCTGAWITKARLGSLVTHTSHSPGGDDPEIDSLLMGGCRPPSPPPGNELEGWGLRPGLGPKNMANPYAKENTKTSAKTGVLVQVSGVSVSKT